MNCLTRVLVVLALAGPAAMYGSETLVVLDHNTGTTLQLTDSPWILALDQPLLAANARDYVGMYAVEASNGGKRSQYIVAFFWSTVPGRNRFAGTRPGLRLLLDDREFSLSPIAESPREAGISRWPLRPPGRDALLVIYPAEPALLRLLGHAAQPRLRPLPDSDLPPEIWFEPWREAGAAFRNFSESVVGLP